MCSCPLNNSNWNNSIIFTFHRINKHIFLSLVLAFVFAYQNNNKKVLLQLITNKQTLESKHNCKCEKHE